MSDEWQPIETAPRDGTKILAWSYKKGFTVSKWHTPANPEARGHWNNGAHSYTPNYWRALPDPPKENT
jgi:hypothetical protein